MSFQTEADDKLEELRRTLRRHANCRSISS
jgi:hypothetical protein